jgi:NAD(P)-dependent dehydrogenase (short-subunit alcohol dehydrogenase family)
VFSPESRLLNPASVVISGASSGIGLALTRHYLECGAYVAAFARRGELLQALATEFPNQIFCYTLDVRDASAVQLASQDFIAKVGVPNIVIANAGVSVGTLTEYAEDLDAFKQVMDINVLGMVNTFQPFVKAMLATDENRLSPNTSSETTSQSSISTSGQVVGYPTSGRGGKRENRSTLVGIASVAGFRGLPGAGAYSASKAAVMSYLESLRVELRGSGIKVVTIAPGYIKTPMTDINPYPMPFILAPEEAARRIARVIERGSSFAVVPWQMGVVGWVMKRLPNWLYDRLFANAPHKPRGLLKR